MIGLFIVIVCLAIVAIIGTSLLVRINEEFEFRTKWPFVWFWGSLIVILLLAVLSGTERASAQGVLCFERDGLLKGLTQKYGEVAIGGGLLGNGAAMVILSAPDGKSFSIIALTTSGQACLLATGDGLEISPPKNSSEKES
jgi:hypothetical protein